MRSALLILALLQIRPDPVRENELREMALRAQTAAAEREHIAKAQQRKLIFEQRFNALVAAVEKFAKEYNRSKGQAWPKDRIDDLRTAIVQLQEIEPALRPSGR